MVDVCSTENFLKQFQREDGSMIIPESVVSDLRTELAFIENITDPVLKQTELTNLRNAWSMAYKQLQHSSLNTLAARLRIEASIRDAVARGVGATDAIISSISSSHLHYQGSKYSAETQKKQFYAQFVQEYNNLVSKHNLHNTVKGNYDVEIATARHTLAEASKETRGAVRKALVGKYGEDVVLAAEVFETIYANMRRSMLDAGLAIGDQVGYLGRQTYNPDEILKDAASIEDFKELMRSRVDWTKTLGEEFTTLDVKKRAEAIDEYLKQFVYAIDNTSTFQATISKYKKQRKIYYNSPEAWLEVNNKYGYHSGLKDNLHAYMSDVAGKLGAYKTLGAAPDDLIEVLKAKHVKSKTDRDIIDRVWKAYKGGNKEENWISKTTMFMTQWASTALLTKAPITALTTDLPEAIATLVEKGFVGNRVEAGINIFAHYTRNLSKEAREEVATNLALFLDNADYSISRYVDNEGARGMLSTIQSAMFRFGGLELTTNAAKTALAMTAIDKLFQSFKGTVDPKLMQYVDGFNFMPHEKKLLSELQLDNGHYRAEIVRDLELDLTTLGAPKSWDANRVKAEFLNKIGLMANNIATSGVPTPTIRERVKLGRDRAPNNIPDALLYLNTQFLSTPLKGFYNMIGNFQLEGVNKWTIAYNIGMRTAGIFTMGILGQYLRDFASGKIDEDYSFQPWFIKAREEGELVERTAEWVMRSNIMGLWGDAVLGQVAYGGGSLAEAVAGPSLQIAGRAGAGVINKILQYKNGKDVDFTDADKRFIMRSTPILSHPIVTLPMVYATRALEE